MKSIEIGKSAVVASQAALGVIAGPILCFACDLRGKFSRILMQEN